MAPPRQPDPDGGRTRSAHAKSVRPDESSDSPCAERHHRLSGLQMMDAIVAGERNPVTLARLCHARVKSSEDTVAKSLEGHYRPEHVFALKQSLAGFRYY